MYPDFIENFHHRSEAMAQPVRGSAFFLLEHGERLWRFQVEALERYQGLLLGRMREALQGHAVGPAVLADLAHHWLEDSHRLVELSRGFQVSAETLLREGPVVPLRRTWAASGA